MNCPRCFSPGDAILHQDWLLAENCSDQHVRLTWGSKVNQFLAEAEILLSHSPRAKAPGQFMFG
jgi:hypothetical protein